MKKFIAISMIALLAVTSVFAGFSGSATASLKADFDKAEYGFVNGAGEFSLSFDATTLNGEAKGEGQVYAEVAATAKVEATEFEDEAVIDGAPVTLAATVSLDKFAVVGKDWNVDLLGAQGAANLAGDWYKDGKFANLDFALATVPGVTVDVYGYKVGVGFWKDNAGTQALLSFNTKDFDFDGLKLTAGTAMAKDKADDTLGLDVSAKLGFAKEDLKLDASVATDVVMNIPVKEGAKFGVDADVLANVKYDFVTLNAYYATFAKLGFAGDAGAKNYYTVGLSFDFANLFAPVKLNLNVLNITDKTGKFAADTEYAFEGGKVTANGGYEIPTKTWNAGVGAEYTIDQVGKIAADIALEGAKEVGSLKLNVSLENTTLVNGATLKLAYNSGNYLAKPDAEIGAITASVSCAF